MTDRWLTVWRESAIGDYGFYPLSIEEFICRTINHVVPVMIGRALCLWPERCKL